MIKFYNYFSDTKPYIQLLMLTIMVVVFLFVGSFVSMLFIPIFSDEGDILKSLIDFDNNISFLRFMQTVSQLFCMFLPAVLFAFMFHSNVVDFFKLRFSKAHILIALLGCVIFVVAIPFIEVITQWNNSLHLPDSMCTLEQHIRDMGLQSEEMVEKFLTQEGGGALLLANLFVMALVPAVSEELIFRGAIQQTCANWFRNHHFAILFTAAIFSIIHFDLFNFMPRFFMGILLGYLFYLSGSIWTSIIAHFTNNALIVFVYYFLGPESAETFVGGGDVNALLVVVSVVMIISFMAIVIYYAKRKKLSV